MLDNSGRTAVLDLVNGWEQYCGAVSLPVDMSTGAREALLDGVAQVFGRRRLDVPELHRLAFASNADLFVREWLVACEQRRNDVRLAEQAGWVLAGQLMTPIALTGVDPISDSDLVAIGPRVRSGPYTAQWFAFTRR